jgi:hypothetical protein
MPDPSDTPDPSIPETPHPYDTGPPIYLQDPTSTPIPVVATASPAPGSPNGGAPPLSFWFGFWVIVTLALLGLTFFRRKR